MSLNRTTLQGRLTRDVELRRTNSGTPVASFTVAWSEKYGEAERKLFLSCVAWKSTAEMLSRYFAKGQEIIVEGNLTSRQWEDRNGNKRETVELTVDRVHFCGPKREGGDTSNTYNESDYTPPAEPVEVEDDGELPF